MSEAVKLGIPVVAVVDSNNSPDGVDYVIPGNDDAIRSIQLYVHGAADAIIEGREVAAATAGMADEEGPAEAAPNPEDAGSTTGSPTWAPTSWPANGGSGRS